jgi:predicted acetyltransferase
MRWSQSEANFMNDATDGPKLIRPSATVRDSFLAGERETAVIEHAPTQWLDRAADDFDEFIRKRCAVLMEWDVPGTVFWYVNGTTYLGSLVIRHALTPFLLEAGGHVGYHVVAPWRRQGHATRMLHAGLDECRHLGLTRVLLTCAVGNEWSRRTIVANGGVPDGQGRGEDRFWIDL